MRLAARIALCLTFCIACSSGSSEDDEPGSGGQSSGGQGSGGKSSGGKGGAGGGNEGGETSGEGGETSSGGSAEDGGSAGSGQGGFGGTPECEEVACLRPYECVLECGGEVLYSSCCPCEAPTFDGYGCDGEGGTGAR